MNGYRMHLTIPFQGMVKKLVILNVAIWLFVQLLLETWILGKPIITQYLALFPYYVVNNFYIWQPLTYMFLHSTDWTHILFNMLMLWFVGAELEQRWGSRFFLTYYIVSGVGAGFITVFGASLFVLLSGGDMEGLMRPVIGASGAIFGLFLAYGIIFGERIIYFMMIFPMKAKYMVMLLGAIQLVSLLNSGFSGQVAYLTHLGGIPSGYLFLKLWSYFHRQGIRRKTRKRGRKLRLVVNNRDDDDDLQGPRYWN